jgi:hypothetical protein
MSDQVIDARLRSTDRYDVRVTIPEVFTLPSETEVVCGETSAYVVRDGVGAYAARTSRTGSAIDTIGVPDTASKNQASEMRGSYEWALANATLYVEATERKRLAHQQLRELIEGTS